MPDPPASEPASAAETLLFFYGTFRRGSLDPHADFVHRAGRWVGTGTMAGRLFRIGTMAGAVSGPVDDGTVTGDVLALPGGMSMRLLASLDRFAGIGAGFPQPPPFRRATVPVTMATGAAVQCEAYLYNRPLDDAKPVPGGNWIAAESRT